MLDRSKIYKLLAGSDHRWILLFKSIFVGIIAGILVSCYRVGIEYGARAAVYAYAFLREKPVAILPWLAFSSAAAYISYKLIRWEPLAKGSGIPQVEGIVLRGMKIKWYTVLAVRFIGGLLVSLFGLSVGREGPSIQIGAAGAQAFCKCGEKNKVEHNYLITAGAAAGLSAAFNAPLSGIMFALEEIHRSFSPRILVAATTAALIADMISSLFFGLTPVLGFLEAPQFPLAQYPWLLLAGVFSGLTGSAMNRLLLLSGSVYEKIPAPFRILLALLIALPCGIFLPQALGGGQNLIRLVGNMEINFSGLILLLAVKILFTCSSFGSGVPGGIFLPILSIGALSGGILGSLAQSAGLPAGDTTMFFICSMAGALSASVKAPVTSILLIAEMTGSLTQTLPVALVAFIALFTSDLLRITPIYEELLERIADKGDRPRTKSKKGALVEIPVEPGSEVVGKKISEAAWPAGLLIVGLRRGETELVPNGETEILAGDYLVALSSEHSYAEARASVCELCRSKSD